MILSRLDFRNRFTQTEKARIYAAAESVIDVRIWLDDLAVSEEVDTENPQTIGAIQALEAAGLLDPGRTAADVLASASATGTYGGFSVGEQVRVLAPFSAAFPDTYTIEAVGVDALIINGSSFAPIYLEHV